jgi:hypothetical protein
MFKFRVFISSPYRVDEFIESLTAIAPSCDAVPVFNGIVDIEAEQDIWLEVSACMLTTEGDRIIRYDVP